MVARYEGLRRAALEKGHVSNSPGMAILLHHGMAAWSRNLKKAELVNEGSRNGIHPGSGPSSQIQSEMVTMLAGMVLDCAKGDQGNGRYTFEG
jgi:hypothetical protein